MQDRLQAVIDGYAWDDNRKDWWARRLIEDAAIFAELGNNRQFRLVSDRWTVPVLMMPKGANTVASGRNKELVTNIVANELRGHGWKTDMFGMKGFQPGRYCTVKNGDTSFDLGLAEFSSEKPYVIWDSKTGQEVCRFRADPKKIASYLLATK